MEYQELRVDQNLVIVNKDLWDKTKQQAMHNEAEIDQMAEDRYKEYLQNNELTFNVTFEGNTFIKNVKCRMIEINPDNRGYNSPINKHIAAGIAEQIMRHVNAKYKGPVERANQIITDYKKQAIIDMNNKFMTGLLIGVTSTVIAATLGAAICSIF